MSEEFDPVHRPAHYNAYPGVEVIDLTETVDHPPHYLAHPSGVECIEIAEAYPFNVGAAIKYLWRAGLKGGTHEKRVEDLRKAAWFVQREVARVERLGPQ